MTYRDLDKQDSYRMVNIDMGPTFGMTRVPVALTKFVTDPGDYTIIPWDTVLLINQTPQAMMNVNLPLVNRWMSIIGGGTQLVVKDYAGVAASANITLQPFAGNTIIGPSVIQVARGSLIITPNPDKLGWSTVAGIE